uniref:Uncharacterized protein n=1 Tax=Streptomyces phage Scarif TaxID=3158858 RepID=A0AAU7GY99_9CAUD
MSFTAREVFRKTEAARSVQVTEENMLEVSRWCNGAIRTYRRITGDGYGTRIDFQARDRHGRESTERAYSGDWLVFYPDSHRFEVYRPKAYSATFETREERARREELESPEAHARNTMVHQLVLKAMRAQDVATYYGDSSGDTDVVSREITDQIIKLFG